MLQMYSMKVFPVLKAKLNLDLLIIGYNSHFEKYILIAYFIPNSLFLLISYPYRIFLILKLLGNSLVVQELNSVVSLLRVRIQSLVRKLRCTSHAAKQKW